MGRRHFITGGISAGFLVLYAMRTGLSVAIVEIASDHDMRSHDKGVVLSAFYIGCVSGVPRLLALCVSVGRRRASAALPCCNIFLGACCCVGGARVFARRVVRRGICVPQLFASVSVGFCRRGLIRGPYVSATRVQVPADTSSWRCHRDAVWREARAGARRAGQQRHVPAVPARRARVHHRRCHHARRRRRV